MSYTTGLTPNGLPLANDPTQTEAVAGPARSGSTGPSSHSAAAAEIASDSAKVSLAGAMLSQAATGSDIRFDKIAALRQSIEAGTYSIPSADIAEKLVDALLK